MQTVQKKEQAKALFAQRQLEPAKALLIEVCNEDESDVEAWFTLGVIHGATRNMAEAARCFEKSVALMPDLAEGYFNLGKAKMELGDVNAAIVNYQQALKLNPNWPPVLNNLGNAFGKLQQAKEALDCYQKAISLKPDYIEAIVNYSNTVQLLGQYDEAVNGYKRALQLKAGDQFALTNLGSTLLKLERYDDAIECCHYAKQLYPNIPGPLAIEAKIHAITGNWKKANKILKPLIKKHPDNIQVITAFVSICHHVHREDEAIKLALAVIESDKFATTQQRMDLHFELGKLLDKQKRYAKAFEQFSKGNALKPGGYDPETEEKEFTKKTNFFTKEFFQQTPNIASDSNRPIFIIGMPRSGTSLLEQILDSHSQIEGGGELYAMDELAKTAINFTNAPYPECLSQLTPEMASQLSQGYLNKLNNISADASYVTDKMPQNFLHLGTIALLFPNAHVIHCQRDPVDTCLSCYFQNFSSAMTFAHDQRHIAQYYLQYQRLMDHWKNTLDIKILDVNYEALTADQETGTKEILEFLGLPWEEDCLKFYDNKRIVATASNEQVRQPIYQSSVKRWKHYEAFLQPMLEVLNTQC